MYDSRRRAARRELDSVSNQLVYLFDSSGADKQKSIMYNATRALEENWRQQKGLENKIRGLYLLDTVIGWAMRALDVVRESVERVAQDFQAKFQFIANAQQAADKLFAGLLGLANTIQDTNFKTSRDNSLRVVLAVLDRYHELRDDYKELEIPGIEERRIYRAIVDRLGRDGVKMLLEPPKPVDDDNDAISRM
ncbi:hypothetical protein B0I37DRAFT_381539 [Chaetomium sp. MPI-CAGE-AT-0009]|nr:hypothetical protein B0I37DRAFT_381539 [Chaetomium sp. MPI-CAGE-AT-0009]